MIRSVVSCSTGWIASATEGGAGGVRRLRRRFGCALLLIESAFSATTAVPECAEKPFRSSDW